MTQFIPFSCDEAPLLPPDAKDWLATDDVAHFVVKAVERVPLSAFAIRPVCGGKAQDHPRLTLALLICCHAKRIFSSRRIERATHRDIGLRYIAANLHPDHDTIAAFRAPIARPSSRCCCWRARLAFSAYTAHAPDIGSKIRSPEPRKVFDPGARCGGMGRTS